MERGYSLAQADVQYKVPVDYSHPTVSGLDPYYDAYGYHVITGEFNPKYNQHAQEQYKSDEFAEQAAKAAAEALARSKAYVAEQEETSTSVSTTTTPTTPTTSTTPTTGTVDSTADTSVDTSCGYDWNAYYQYYGTHPSQSNGYSAEAAGATAASEYYQAYQHSQGGDYYAQYAQAMQAAASSAYTQQQQGLSEGATGPMSREEIEYSDTRQRVGSCAPSLTPPQPSLTHVLTEKTWTFRKPSSTGARKPSSKLKRPPRKKRTRWIRSSKPPRALTPPTYTKPTPSYIFPHIIAAHSWIG